MDWKVPVMLNASPTLIAFGSNMDPLPNLRRGLALLHQEIGIRAVSTVYRTAALPDPDQPLPGPDPDFLNGAVWVETQQDPFALKKRLRAIEAALHRVRGADAYAPRTLDLDIALMGEVVLQKEGLVVPDPEIAHRSFVAIPLAELAPHALHPWLNLSFAQIATRFDALTVDAEATAVLRALIQRP